MIWCGALLPRFLDAFLRSVCPQILSCKVLWKTLLDRIWRGAGLRYGSLTLSLGQYVPKSYPVRYYGKHYWVGFGTAPDFATDP